MPGFDPNNPDMFPGPNHPPFQDPGFSGPHLPPGCNPNYPPLPPFPAVDGPPGGGSGPPIGPPPPPGMDSPNDFLSGGGDKKCLPGFQDSSGGGPGPGQDRKPLMYQNLPPMSHHQRSMSSFSQSSDEISSFLSEVQQTV